MIRDMDYSMSPAPACPSPSGPPSAWPAAPPASAWPPAGSWPASGPSAPAPGPEDNHVVTGHCQDNVVGTWVKNQNISETVVQYRDRAKQLTGQLCSARTKPKQVPGQLCSAVQGICRNSCAVQGQGQCQTVPGQLCSTRTEPKSARRVLKRSTVQC